MGSGSKLMAADLAETQSPTTLEGQKVSITKGANGAVKFATAAVTVADFECSNGVIHVIDAVVLPPAVSTSKSAEVSNGYRSGVVASFLYLSIAVLFCF